MLFSRKRCEFITREDKESIQRLRHVASRWQEATKQVEGNRKLEEMASNRGKQLAKAGEQRVVRAASRGTGWLRRNSANPSLM